jgi:ATP adenylyltransferase
MVYLESESRSDGCFLCDVGSGVDEADIVVWRGERVYALLNAYPYTNGHVMVAPYAHEGQLDKLDDETSSELMSATRLVLRALRAAINPDGFNVGANLGSAAGAGYGDHLHIHVVPRWNQDTNFMATTAGTRVIPEALADTAKRVRTALQAIIASQEEQP